MIHPTQPFIACVFLSLRRFSDEHDAKHGVRSGPYQPLAPEQRDKPGASSCQQDTPENREVM
jgi:hypothetical protein